MKEETEAVKKPVHETLKKLENKPVIVMWRDACNFMHSWQDLSDLDDENTEYRCISVGFLVKIRTTDIVLLQNIGNIDFETRGQGSRALSIPLLTVISVSELEEMEATYVVP